MVLIQIRILAGYGGNEYLCHVAVATEDRSKVKEGYEPYLS